MSDEYEQEESRENDIPGEEDEIIPAATVNPNTQIELSDDAINLVPMLLDAAKNDDKIKEFIEEKLPCQVVDEFKENWDARAEWMKRREVRANLFYGNIKDKTGSFKDAANIHKPIILKSIIRLVARLHSEIFKQGQPVFTCRAAEKERQDLAERRTLHSNWQLTQQIVDFPTQVWMGEIDFFLHGECIWESYYDPDTGMNRHEFLSADEFVYPYVHRTTMPDMSDVPVKTRIIRKRKRDLRRLEKQGVYAQVEKVTAEKSENEFEAGVDHPLREAMDKWQGLWRGDCKKDAPYFLLCHDTWIQFPGMEEDTPVRVVVDAKTKTVLQLTTRWEQDLEDRARFDQQNAEFEKYNTDVDTYVQAMQAEQELAQRMSMPDVQPEEGAMMAQEVQAARPPAPMAPRWMIHDEEGNPTPPAPVKKRVIERYSRSCCIEVADGSHGIGVGNLLEPHQKAANIMLNQGIDLATLSNEMALGGLMHTNVRLPAGVKRLNPAELTRVDGVPPSDVANAIVQWKAPPANPQLFQAAQEQAAEAEEAASTPDVMSGAKEGDETFRGMATRIDQATKQTSVFSSKFLQGINNLAKNNARLNYYNLPDSQSVSLVDPRNNAVMNIEVSRELYKDDFVMAWGADLTFTSRSTRVAEADDVLTMLMKGIPPEIAKVIFQGGPFLIVAAAVRQCLKARGMYDLASLVLTDQQIQQMVQQLQQQAQQQAMMGMPQPGQPSPGQAARPGAPSPKIPTGQPPTAPGVRPVPASQAPNNPNVNQVQ